MIYIEEIQIDEKRYYSAVTWGILAIIYAFILNFVLEIPIYSLPKNMTVLGLLSIVGLLYMTSWVIRIAIFIWIIIIAKKLNRSRFIWGLFGFIFPPITLIIIGFQNYNIEDSYVNEILEKARSDFREEIDNLNSDRDFTWDELNEKKDELKEKYNKELRKKVCDYIAKERETSKETDSHFLVKQNVNIITQNDFENLDYDENKCPACGAPIDDTMKICYECGLALK